MKKVLLGAVVVLAFVVGAWSVLDGARAPEDSPRPNAGAATGGVDAAGGTTAGDATSPTRAATRSAPAIQVPLWRLTGTVVDADAKPVVDAAVAVHGRWDGRGDDAVVAAVRTDHEGRYVADLAPLREQPPIDLERASLALVVRAPGQFAVAVARLPHTDAERDLFVRVDVVLQRGAVVAGRVVDATGTGVLGADVELAIVREHADERSEPARPATTNADGSYVLFAPHGSAGVLAARHVEAGRGEARCQLVPGADTTLPDVVLRRTDTLRGRVVFADGEPASGVDIGILRPDGDDGSYRSVRTGPDGWFVAHSIDRRTSRLRVRSISKNPSLPEPLATTDGEPVTIVLAGMHQVRLRFQDAAGRGLRPLDVGLGRWGAEHSAALTAFAAGADLAPELERGFQSGAGGFRSFLVASGTWVAVRSSHRGAHAEALVHVVPPQNVHDVVLTLREREPTAILRVRLAVADRGAVGDIALRLRQLRLGEPGSYELATERDGDALVARWAPGRYRLEAKPSLRNSDLGCILPFTQLVELHAGETTEVDATLRPHGRVRLHFHTPDPAVREPIADLSVVTAGDAGTVGERQTFVLFRPDGWEAQPHALANQPLVWMPLLPPGRHVLTIRSRDYVDVDVGVDVAPRVATDVHVWLQAK